MTDPAIAQFVGVLATGVGACALALGAAKFLRRTRPSGATLAFSPLWAVAGTFGLIDALIWMIFAGNSPGVFAAAGVFALIVVAQASLLAGCRRRAPVVVESARSSADSPSMRRAA